MGNWKAGVASTVITPEESMWLAGFARRTMPAQGKASELYTKALALEDGEGKRLVILTADLIAMPREIADWIAKRCAAEFGLGREQLLLATSHTHSGPEVRPNKVLFFNIPDQFAVKIPGFVEKLQEKMLQTIREALSKLSGARLHGGQGRARFAHNRRGAEEYFDHDAPAMKVTDLENRPLAILFGYACHNTTLWEDSYVYCGDYAGFAQARIQEKFPGVTALFLCGAAADQNPDPRAKLEYAKAYGNELGEGVAGIEFVNEIEPRLSAAFEEVPLDFQPTPSREELQAQTASTDKPIARKAQYLLDHPNDYGPTYPYPVQVIRLGGELMLIALGGEPVVEYAMKLKKEYAGGVPLVWVAGYANDMFGYVPTLRVQREGGYEGGRAVLWAALPMPWTETVEPRIMEAVRRMVKKV